MGTECTKRSRGKLGRGPHPYPRDEQVYLMPGEHFMDLAVTA